jgi:ABC-type uncharacterized transport system substrate-binding protein
LCGVDPFFDSKWKETAELAVRYRVPTSHEVRDFVAAGGLMSYAADLPEAYRLTGVYAGRVLKGEKPAELPVIELIPPMPSVRHEIVRDPALTSAPRRMEILRRP